MFGTSRHASLFQLQLIIQQWPVADDEKQLITRNVTNFDLGIIESDRVILFPRFVTRLVARMRPCTSWTPSPTPKISPALGPFSTTFPRSISRPLMEIQTWFASSKTVPSAVFAAACVVPSFAVCAASRTFSACNSASICFSCSSFSRSRDAAASVSAAAFNAASCALSASSLADADCSFSFQRGQFCIHLFLFLRHAPLMPPKCRRSSVFRCCSSSACSYAF